MRSRLRPKKGDDEKSVETMIEEQAEANKGDNARPHKRRRVILFSSADTLDKFTSAKQAQANTAKLNVDAFAQK